MVDWRPGKSESVSKPPEPVTFQPNKMLPCLGNTALSAR